jgi:hypothetical protein
LAAHLRGKLNRKRGSLTIELALAMSLVFPLLLGVGAIGLRLNETLEATQLTHDVAHMYAWGADFTLPGTQAVATTLGQNFNLTSTGTAMLLFSTIYVVQQTDCTAAGLSNCPNLNLPVFAQRVTLGNTSLYSSHFGTPPAAYIGTSGNIASADYCQYSSLVASGFSSVLALSGGQQATVVEGYFSMPDLSLLGYNGLGGGYYARFLY